jgi:AraC family transcriptional regulator
MGKWRMPDFAEIRLSQKDGSPPQTVVGARPPGESGVSIARVRFDRVARISAASRRHLIFLQTSQRVPIECRMDGRISRHQADTGSLAICPAEVEGFAETAETETSIGLLLIAVDPGQLALAAAEDASVDARLDIRLSGRDPKLLAIAHLLSVESGSGYPNGSLYWSEMTNRLLGRLVQCHSSKLGTPVRGRLGHQALQKIRSYVMANLGEPIQVDDLAALAGRSAFHFSRVFSRSVGMTPYRYVIHLRLQAALALIREKRMSLAEIAADTGFADQSHMSRWIRRVHGIAPSALS